jgi:hypothetical protein
LSGVDIGLAGGDATNAKLAVAMTTTTTTSSGIDFRSAAIIDEVKKPTINHL